MSNKLSSIQNMREKANVVGKNLDVGNKEEEKAIAIGMFWSMFLEDHVKEAGAVIRRVKVGDGLRYCIFGDFTEKNEHDIPGAYWEYYICGFKTEKCARNWCVRNKVSKVAFEGRGQ